MTGAHTAPKVLIIGGGMITHDQILPSLLHMQRSQLIGEISVSARTRNTIEKLQEAAIFREAFPDQSFVPYEEIDYREIIHRLPPRQIVVVALPDQLHFDAVMTALKADQNVLCVKPLVLSAAESITIEREAGSRGLLVAVEYHKRFDDRSLMARGKYRAGQFGEFRLGSAWLMEKWYYRHSNFQNWCTAENSDAFAYIGCHYVDLVHFITGLLPTAVSVYGIKGDYPNGKEGFLWTDARVLWNNGACLNVQNSLSFPDAAPGTNTQGLKMHFSTADAGGYLEHSDQYRGLQYCYTEPRLYTEPSPDYFQYVNAGGRGLVPVGYGYRSIEHIVRACLRVNAERETELRRSILKQIDHEGILATPANSRYNELVMEAGRLSILNGGREVPITYP